MSNACSAANSLERAPIVKTANFLDCTLTVITQQIHWNVHFLSSWNWLEQLTHHVDLKQFVIHNKCLYLQIH